MHVCARMAVQNSVIVTTKLCYNMTLLRESVCLETNLRVHARIGACKTVCSMRCSSDIIITDYCIHWKSLEQTQYQGNALLNELGQTQLPFKINYYRNFHHAKPVVGSMPDGA